ncbi:Hypothetical_protein [Hexamita inflata]|uniref:Hypothetical_protein n=1 Tax=Hexamita inflata TaxID=28002 RepID=A0AA86QBD0_9EUKA|nr:Hypothetical protein HINF_LOCUS40572 [Hexamita inflata]
MSKYNLPKILSSISSTELLASKHSTTQFQTLATDMQHNQYSIFNPQNTNIQASYALVQLQIPQQVNQIRLLQERINYLSHCVDVVQDNLNIINKNNSKQMANIKQQRRKFK